MLVKNKTPLVSIIVPVYNVELYLPKCVDSIINQTYRNIEILLVNDGSSDSSGKLCDEYSRKYEYIRSYHKKNGGLSSARNYGIARAKGAYIGFVDSDDFVDNDMFEYLIGLAEQYNADVSGCDIYDCYNNKDIKKHSADWIECLDTIGSIKCVLDSKTSMNVVNKLFKKELFEETLFTEGITLEDAYIIVDLLSKTKRAVFTNSQKYYYLHRGNSITTLPFNEHSYDALKVHDHNYKVATSISESLEPSANLRRCWARFYVLDKMMMSDGNYDKSVEKECIVFLKKRKRLILSSSMFTSGRKLAFCGLLISKKLYRAIVKKHTYTRRKVYE